MIRSVDTSSPQPEPARRARAATGSPEEKAFAALHAAALSRANPSPATARTSQASTTAPSAADTPASPGADLPGANRKRDERVPSGESWKPVSGTKDYAEITAGPRKGQYVNLSGNARDGMAFAIEFREGKRFHVYGEGAGREELEVPPSAGPPAGSRRGGVTPPKGETWGAVTGRDDYADILTGPRNGHYVNLSGNAREGRDFLIVRRDGSTYHVYGSGADKESIRVRTRDDA